jgi:hypothetical protein
MNHLSNIYNATYKSIYTTYKVDDLDTGDIIVFNGYDSIISYIVECVTWSKYSHCGIVLKNPRNIGIDVPDGIYMIESGYDTPPDITTGKKKFGVEIVDLKKCLEDYTGNVYCIKLEFERTAQILRDLGNSYNLVKKDIYDVNPLDLIKTILNINVGNNNRTTSFICSALVAYILYSCSIIYYVNWDLIEPKDFACLTNDNNLIRFNKKNNISKNRVYMRQQILFKPEVKINRIAKLYID